MSAPSRFLFVGAPGPAAAALAAVRRAGPVSAQLAPSADALRSALVEPGAAWDAVVVVPGGPVDEVEAALYVPEGTPLVVFGADGAFVLSDDGARDLSAGEFPMLRAAGAAEARRAPAVAVGELCPAGDGPAPASAPLSAPASFSSTSWGDGVASGDPIPPSQPPRPGGSSATNGREDHAERSERARPPILVVEDNGDTRMLLERILRSTYDVTAVADARSALLAMNGRRFRGLVLDINLGGKETGADVLRIARSLAGYEDVFAIALTAYALPGDRERLLEAGFNEYISKPFTRQSLMDALAAGVQA